MQPELPNCFHRAARASGEGSASGAQPIDSRTTQAFHLLRFHAEDLALELAARLRVLGKSLTAACPEQGPVASNRAAGSIAYQGLRRQLDGFLGSLAESGHAGQHYFPVIHRYLQNGLPLELHGCVGDEACRIERVEAVISLLSDNFCENEEFTEVQMLSFSL